MKASIGLVRAFGEAGTAVAGKAPPGAPGDELEAVGVAGAVHMAVGLYLAEGEGLVPARTGALAEEIDSVDLGLRHCVVQITGFRAGAQAGGHF